MITNYKKPQSTISQFISVRPQASASRTQALILGSEYLLSLSDGRDVPKTSYTSAGDSLDYSYITDGVTYTVDPLSHTVDTSYVRLFGVDLEAEVANITTFEALGDGSSTKLTLPVGVDNLTGSSLHANLDGRAVKVGDLVEVSVDNSEAVPGTHVSDVVYNRKVVGFIPRVEDATINGAGADAVAASSPTNFADNAVADSVLTSGPTGHVINETAVVADKFLEVGGKISGRLAETLTITCTVAGAPGTAEFSVSYSTLGESEVIVSTDEAGAYGLALTKYAGTTLEIDMSGGAVTSATAGDVYGLIVYPVHAADGYTMFEVADPTTYTGTAKTTYVLEVTQGSNNAAGVLTAEVQIYDTENLDVVATQTIVGSGVVALGTFGLSVTIDASAAGFPDLAKGDRFYFELQTAGNSATENVGLILDAPVYDPNSFDVAEGSFEVSIREAYTGEITSANVAVGDAFTATSTEVTYPAGLSVVTSKVASPRANFVEARGSVYPVFRAAKLTGITEGPIEFRSITDITDQVGEIHPDNDLAYGVWTAFKGADSGVMYGSRVNEDTVVAYQDSLRRIESTDKFYSLCPMTSSLDVIQAVVDHCQEMSNKFNKNFRRCYAGFKSEGVYEFIGTRSDSTARKATVAVDTLTIDPADAADTNFVTLGVNVGDIVKFPALDSEHAVLQVISATDLVIENPPIAGVDPALAFSVWKSGTAEDEADFIIDVAKSINDERCMLVWCDSGTVFGDSGYEVVHPKYLAAELVGRRSIMLPQQGLTYTEVTSITEAPLMYTKYRQSKLDEVAANGVCIIAQESEGGNVFVRHQLTTSVDKGPLYSEDNVGIIVDSLSFDVKDSDGGFIGKKNVTEETIIELRDAFYQVLNDATQTTLTESQFVGPMIVGYSDENGEDGRVTVRRDADLADRIIRAATVRVPLPLNNLDNYITVDLALLSDLEV